MPSIRVVRRTTARSNRLFLLSFLALLAAVLSGCSRDADGGLPDGWLASESDSPWNLLLVTLDTTRSDRLGCYGYDRSTSPCIDRLAERSILFENAVAPAPITLPSHTTMLTGLDPHEHGVRNNATFALSESHVTLAEVLKPRGYTTGATLGAVPVHRRSGLSQGFDHYDDAFGEIDTGGGPAAVDPLAVERTADDVTDRAIRWIEAHRDEPFFHWVHFFDPHYPWTAPAPFAERFEEPYDAEIAFMDDELGRIIRELERLDLSRNTWILLVGDHGESLYDHEELMHGMLIYGATQSVPCILTPPLDWKAAIPEDLCGHRVGAVAPLKDIFPTLCNALGVVPADPAPTGPSLLALAAGTWEGPPAAYTEAMAPYLDFGWSPLRGVRTAEWSYIRGVEPELYDLAADPCETKNVAADYPDVVKRLSALCDSMIENEVALQAQAVGRDTAQKLRSLGYAASPVRIENADFKSDKDPRKLAHLLGKVTMAAEAHGQGRTDEAIASLTEVLRKDPGNPLATRHLGDIYLAVGEYARFRDLYETYTALHPEDADGMIRLANAHISFEDYDAAIAILEKLVAADAGADAAEVDPAAADLFPQVLTAAGRVDEAREHLDSCLTRNPRDPDAYARLSFLEMIQGDRRKALKLAKLALSYDTDHAEANALAGELIIEEARAFMAAENNEAMQDMVADAREHFVQALASEPTHPAAAFQLARILQNERRFDDARSLYEIALRGRPDWAEARARLADVLMELKEPGLALGHYAAADALGFAHPLFLLKYGAALAMTGRRADAKTVWERALALDPPEALAARLRENIEKVQ